MDYLITFLLAALVAFVGFLPPGMINMTALNLGIGQGRRPALLFVSGAITIILIQAFLAVSFAKYLTQNQQIIQYLNYAAIVIFFALSALFFWQARKETKLDIKEPRKSYLAGLTMSSMNMLAIPFFLGYSTIMESRGLLNLDIPHNFVFAFGAALGSFFLFFLYILFAEFIVKRLAFIAQNINYILSLLFLALALLTIYKSFF